VASGYGATLAAFVLADLLERSVWGSLCSPDARCASCDDLQLLDDVTTVDPSYTISLIRQLLPQGSNVEKEFR
jgi:hypothetical protein